jgi:hypothetical protein
MANWGRLQLLQVTLAAAVVVVTQPWLLVRVAVTLMAPLTPETEKALVLVACCPLALLLQSTGPSAVKVTLHSLTEALITGAKGLAATTNATWRVVLPQGLVAVMLTLVELLVLTVKLPLAELVHPWQE